MNGSLIKVSIASTAWTKIMKEGPSLTIHCIYTDGFYHSITPNNQIWQDAGLQQSSVATPRTTNNHTHRSSAAVNKTHAKPWMYTACVTKAWSLPSPSSTENWHPTKRNKNTEATWEAETVRWRYLQWGLWSLQIHVNLPGREKKN